MLKDKKTHKEPDAMADNSNKEAVEDIVIAQEVPIGDLNSSGDDTLNLNPELKTSSVDWNDKYIRLYAEFDNFKRRTLKEQIELMQTANKDVIIKLLPVLDDFDRAMKSIETTADIASIKEGIALIQHKLKGILSQKGLKEMESKGHAFDAELHEGITNVPAPEESLKGKVIDELEKGYFLNDKVIRFAKVIIGA